MIARRLAIHGKVQGVGYRWSMVREARRLGVSGWVRNRLDGSVEALVQGDPAAIDAIVAWSRHGPQGAKVVRVEVSEQACVQLAGFDQVHSA